jgi:hypothetical protein
MFVRLRIAYPGETMNLPAALVLGCVCAVISTRSTADDAADVDLRFEDGKVAIRSEQIRSYDWKTHTLRLAPKVREHLAIQLRQQGPIVTGIPFSLAVGGDVIYTGVFTSMVSSWSFSTPVIVVDAQTIQAKLKTNELQIQLGYPTSDFFRGNDPRNHLRIQQALKAAGKLASPNTGADWAEKCRQDGP